MVKKVAAKKKRKVFNVRAEPGSEVLIAGSFNNWDISGKNKKVMKDETGKGEFSRILVLPPGQYEYKFYINGEWVADDSAQWVRNKMGTLNSVFELS